MNKLVLFTIVVILGGALAAFIDNELGINLSAVPYWPRIAHGITYLLWGAALMKVVGNKSK